ncbi:hypothetical protein LCGC14_0295760 [marine sediment metagenome]|uniref:Uncharacterized protein n=1 Tax=marine sediment metagenome TaxID=412755 RepID=A0A0F9WD20_9ZZZZ|nr:hypothetical protein [Phycisphaerae bacterium]HDZ43014.1 hypothetical protein [Phycisphaerae bacterium]
MVRLLDDKMLGGRKKLSGPVAVAMVLLGVFLLSLYFMPWVRIRAYPTPGWFQFGVYRMLPLGEASGYDLAAGLWRDDWSERANFRATSLCGLGGLIAPICIVAVVLMNRLGWLRARRAWWAFLVLGLVGVAVATVVSQIYYSRNVIGQMRNVYVRAQSTGRHAIKGGSYRNLVTEKTDDLWLSLRLYVVMASVAAAALVVPVLKALGERVTKGRLSAWLAKVSEAKRAILGPPAEEAARALGPADGKAPGPYELLRGGVVVAIICSACVLLVLYFTPWVVVEGFDSSSYGPYAPMRTGKSTGFELATGPWGGDWPAHVSVTVLSFCMSLAPIVPVCILAVVLANLLKRLTARRTWWALLLLGLAGGVVVATPTRIGYPHLVMAQMGDAVVHSWVAQGYLSPASFDNLTLEYTFGLWSSFWAYAALAAVAFVAVTSPKFKAFTEPAAAKPITTTPPPIEPPTKATGVKKVLTGRTVRWTLLTLYVVTILVLAAIWVCQDWGDLPRPWGVFFIAIPVWFFSQGLFILTAAGRDLYRPLRRRMLVVPVVIAAFMMGVLLTSMTGALAELSWGVPGEWLFLGVLLATWGIWAVAFFIYTRQSSRLGVLKRLVTVLVAGSLLETIVAAYAHAIVSRRPGCLVGIHTSVAIDAGVCVGLWAFGPGIAILFLHARAQQKKRRQRPTPPEE